MTANEFMSREECESAVRYGTLEIEGIGKLRVRSLHGRELDRFEKMVAEANPSGGEKVPTRAGHYAIACAMVDGNGENLFNPEDDADVDKVGQLNAAIRLAVVNWSTQWVEELRKGMDGAALGN